MRITQIAIDQFKGLGSVVLDDCQDINVLVGKNNSGKSSVLHAIDMAGLALSVNNWNRFQPKLEIKDLFGSVGEFAIRVTYDDGSEISLSATPEYGPVKSSGVNDSQMFTTILVWPDVSAGMNDRRHRTPKWVIGQVEERNFAAVDSLQMLHAIRFYALKNERGLRPQDYESLIEEVKTYFPEIEDLESSRTEDDIATLTYTEYERELDILYSGSGLKHFVDVLLKVTISKANIVLLDEPEMGLHPDLQRRFLAYLQRLVEKKGIQLFIATHSQVFLNRTADNMAYYRVQNRRGKRTVYRVSNDAVYTLLGDMGIRPSDIFNQDMCVLVEGASEVVFFEHVIRELYADQLDEIAVGIIQYGGSAADGIVSGSIAVSNIVPAQNYTFWIRDRDAPQGENPSTESTKFRNALETEGLTCHIWKKREIEFYYPEEVLVAAQQGDTEKERLVREILHADQSQKFRNAAKPHEICVPSGKYLQRLLNDHLTSRDQLDPEIRDMVEGTLITWRDEIVGAVQADAGEA